MAYLALLVVTLAVTVTIYIPWWRWVQPVVERALLRASPIRGNRRSASEVSWLHDAIAYRVSNQRGGRRELELAHDCATMCFDGLDTDVQKTGDLLGGVTLGDELNHTTFPLR